ncbi:hypothetical protein GCM10011492_06700 [Flexivirga endophytica]|uniref:Uncharacterized protein n=1 Tax=Flexivirga endophytica TaxID=1849103 RepID=A0A916WQ02_9MICO|nr:hypothetical protein [Flexivirga endophytica]GGB19517.1 hypothetical protein GCM10011492_06700 [Flexivirga endophytica]GHB36178.1 hypothetical protein GCM10008112_00910 [Flexivirga endophytica]
MAKVRRPAPTAPGAIPPELLDQLHPIWRDADALLAHPDFAPYVDQTVISRLQMTQGGYRQYHHVAGRWLVANGFENPKHPGFADWRRFREVVGRR